MKSLKRISTFTLLLPISAFFGIITGLRNAMFNINILTSKTFNTPSVCIGNIAVGGTGKTPHSEYIIKRLEEEFRIAYLSRGYKRQSKGFIIASDSSDAKEIGDEPMQIKNKFPNIIVAVDANRRRAIKKLEALPEPPELIILDDAFQHRYVKTDISILLTDYNHPFYFDFLMPSGRLRETKHAKDRAQVIIVTKCEVNITPIEKRVVSKHIAPRPYQEVFFTSMTYGDITPVFAGFNTISKKDRSYYTSFILTGIANPEPLYKKLDKIFVDRIPLKYPDHHNFSKDDIEHISKQFREHANNKKCIITTEKDAMRLRTMDISDDIKSNLFYIPIEPHFIDNNEDHLIKQIRDYVTKNKGMHFLH
ncbi:MAG: tetraacyldisaccharide 4'-kinase [Marinifilaceae bacterium]